MADYDSAKDTKTHIGKVQNRIWECVINLNERARVHDASKLQEPEKSGYDVLGQLLYSTPYGTPEYFAVMNDEPIKGAIQHHITNNRHHPEAHQGGANGMTLLDILEMFCDWKAASERNERMTFEEGLGVNREKRADEWGIDEQLWRIFENTRRDLGW